VGIGILVLLIVITGVAAARSVTTPLRELATAARRFGREGHHQPLAARTADELGALVTSFNTMAVDLQRSREEIEHLHAREMERAQQLATVGELASGVAHEIRNPLTGVRGAIELALRRLPVEEPARPLLEEAQQQLARIEGATTQLLRFARPPEPREVTVDASLLVERALHVVASRAETAGITLREERAAAAAPVRVDPELMVQVLVNLMLNGIEAMSAGGVLTVSLAPRFPDVWISVRDTGAGVPPETRADIFRPFFTTKHQGTGLGLSISQQIVARHHGALRVEDGSPGGATFIVVLPLAETEGERRDDAG
jgi:signal transduction histidine kinase